MKKLSAFFVFLASMQLYGMEGDNNTQAMVLPPPDQYIHLINAKKVSSIGLLTEQHFPPYVSFNFDGQQVTPAQKNEIMKALVEHLKFGNIEGWVKEQGNTEDQARRSVNLSPLTKILNNNGYIDKHFDEFARNIGLAKKLQETKNLLKNPQVSQAQLIDREMLEATAITYNNHRLPIGNETDLINALNGLVLKRIDNPQSDKTHVLEIGDFAKTVIENTTIQFDKDWLITHPDIQFEINENVKDFNNFLETVKYEHGLKYKPKHEMKKKSFLERHYIFVPAMVGLSSVIFSEPIKYAFFTTLKNAPLWWNTYFSKYFEKK